MKNIFFRFSFIFFLLIVNPINWFYRVPGIDYLINGYDQLEVWIVNIMNDYLLHVKEPLNMVGGGSGDTSYAWAQFYTFLILAITGTVVWTIIDRNREPFYTVLGFWLRTTIRYYIAIFAFTYGIIKLFALQMYFPNFSQLATPLGDYLPIRFSWMFIGYSTPYQTFSGIMETIVGILLLNRRTVTAGVLLGVGVFANVFILNLCYDIPVKLFSMQLLICTIYLVLMDGKRLFELFVLNKRVERTDLYEIALTKKWHAFGRAAWKIGFIILFVILPFNDSLARYKFEFSKDESGPVPRGVYAIRNFELNRKNVIPSIQDDWAWKDFIFDTDRFGSINTQDTLFRQRYHRGYFSYQTDTLKEVIAFKKSMADTTNLFQLRYKIVNGNNILFWGKIRSDSVRFELEKTDRQFQLAERQFHWISESNR